MQRRRASCVAELRTQEDMRAQKAHFLGVVRYSRLDNRHCCCCGRRVGKQIEAFVGHNSHGVSQSLEAMLTSSTRDLKSTTAQSASASSTLSTSTSTVVPTSVPLKSRSLGGFAMITPLTENNGSMKLVYWQDPSGNLVEGKYPSAAFLQSSNETVVQAADALPGTPLSAITWMKDSIPHVCL